MKAVTTIPMIPHKYAREVEGKLKEANAEIERLRGENASLMILVKNQRCCRNCGNHWSANFDICGLGKDEVIGRMCRENKLDKWRPMEYRYAKAALEAAGRDRNRS